MIVNLKLGAQRKFKYLKEQKKSDLSENNINVASGPKVQSFFHYNSTSQLRHY